MKYYYFALRGEDPLPSAYAEDETDITSLKKKLVGTWIKAGDEDHDEAQIVDIWTEEQAKAYFSQYD